MAWDSDKSTAADPDNPAADEQLTADEWDNHVTEGHFPADELNFGVDGGDPVMTDPQNADEIVARYDRATGTWVVDSISTEKASITNVSGAAYLTADKSVPDTTVTDVLFDDAVTDDTLSFSNGKLVIEEAGDYIVTLWLLWAGDSNWSTGDRMNPLIQDDSGNTLADLRKIKVSTAAQTAKTPTVIYDNASEGDEIRARAFQDSGASKTITQNNPASSRIIVGRLG